MVGAYVRVPDAPIFRFVRSVERPALLTFLLTRLFIGGFVRSSSQRYSVAGYRNQELSAVVVTALVAAYRVLRRFLRGVRVANFSVRRRRR